MKEGGEPGFGKVCSRWGRWFWRGKGVGGVSEGTAYAKGLDVKSRWACLYLAQTSHTAALGCKRILSNYIVECLWQQPTGPVRVQLCAVMLSCVSCAILSTKQFA
jgi:hypothetical protein